MCVNCRNGVSSSVNIWPLPGQRGLAGLRRHRAQPAARRRIPGQPGLRQGPRRHHPPRPDRRRRPDRPLRPQLSNPAPPAGLAPPDRVDEPVRGRLRTPGHGGLTSPDQVTALPRPKAPGAQAPPQIPEQNPGQAARHVSGRTATPPETSRSLLLASHPGNDHLNLRGGLRLRITRIMLYAWLTREGLTAAV